MRIAILNWSNRLFGGTGTYLSTILPALRTAGHDVALWHEVEDPIDKDPLPMPSGTPTWSVSSLGLEMALSALRSWNPDLLYAHGLLDPAVERNVLDVAPAVFFAHDYYGTCISGSKTFTNPVVSPCDRRFGWQCLMHYYPRRCGGLSPITMMKQYSRQESRLELLSRYKAIVTHSSHMQQEYLRHGLTATRVFNVSCGTDMEASFDVSSVEAPTSGNPWHVLFVGRMDRLKGGQELLSALALAIERLGRPVKLSFAGDGPERIRWEHLATEICQRQPLIAVEFLGWVSRVAIEGLYKRSDLLAVPSLWPEPLSLAGLEATRRGVPAVAFDVGGVSEWLKSGINGVMAPGSPPTVPGLAEAIVSALGDEHAHAQLRHGARQMSDSFSFDTHMQLLVKVFEQVAH